MAGPTHEVRNSLIDSTRHFGVEDDGLTWEEGDRRDSRRFQDIKSVHLIAYPGYGGKHLQCTLTDRKGKKIKIRSHHYISLGNFQNRSQSYGPFVQLLTAGLGLHGQSVTFYCGSKIMRAVWAVLFWLSILVLVGYLFAIIGGVALSWATIATIAIFVTLLPTSWAMIRQNKPETFDPNAPPPDFLG